MPRRGGLCQLREPCKPSVSWASRYIYVGDGYSDQCAALAADRVFARDGLAATSISVVSRTSRFGTSRSSRASRDRIPAYYPPPVTRILLESVTKVFSGAYRSRRRRPRDRERRGSWSLVGPWLWRVDPPADNRRARGGHGGTIMISDRDVTGLTPAPGHRHGFKNYALYPHMSVEPLVRPQGARPPSRRSSGSSARPRGCSASRICSTAGRRRSPGARQRVAMGRAIVREPAAFVDEPLNLDAKLRVARSFGALRHPHDRPGHVQAVHVARPDRAVTLGQRRGDARGLIQQVDKPQVLCASPLTCSSRRSSALPRSDLVEGRVGDGVVEIAGWRLHAST